LGGNPIRNLRSKVFLPLQYLTDLDLSDCDLISVFEDSDAQTRESKIFRNLKYLNISHNEIKNVLKNELSVRQRETPLTEGQT
jgi:Leucine Rich repeat